MFLLMAISKKSHSLMKISTFYWFLESVFFINLEIPTYKLNKTLHLLSIFRFLSILLLFSLKRNSEKQRKINFFLLLLIIFNLCFVINIEKYYEIFFLAFEISLFLLSIRFFTRKQAQKQQENNLFLNALNSSKEGLIILEEKKTFLYEIKLFNQKAYKFLGINETKSEIDFAFLNEKMHGFRFENSKIPKKINNPKESLFESVDKSLKEQPRIFPNLSEIIVFFQQKNKQNESFYFSRLSKKDSFSQNLHLILKKVLIQEKTFYFFSIRKIDSLENLKEKNEINTRLLSSFSHELKTPLNSSIPLLSEVLQTQNPNNNKDYIAKALSCLKLLENSLDNILDYSLILSEQFLINLGFVNIYELLHEVFYIIKEHVELKGLEFSIEKDDSIEENLMIYSDYIRLRQLFLNILLNAIQFTKSKGKISLKISVFSLEPLALEIKISDTGIGIPEEKLLKLKEKLLTNDEITLNSTGSCLGLIISNNIASLLGKYGLMIDSKENEGTTVRFFVVDQSKYDDFKAFNAENLVEKANDKLKELEEEKFVMKVNDISNGCLNENSNLNGTLKENLDENSKKKFNTKTLKTLKNRNKKILKDSRIFNSMRKFNQSIESKMSESISENQRNFWSLSKRSVDIKFSGSAINSLFKIQSNSLINPRKSIFFSKKTEVSHQISMEEKVQAYNFDHLVKLKTQLEINTRLSSDKDSDSDSNSELDLKTNGKLKLFQRGTLNYLNLESLVQINTKKEISAIAIKSCICEDILIVDDDVFNLFSLEIMLKGLNFSCKKATNGQEAIEILKNFKKCHEKCKGIRLVLMDFQMPVLDGVESTKEIQRMILKGEIEEIPVIGCTAFTAKNEVLKCLESGMKDIFFKPLNRNVMQGIIKQWL